MRFLEKLKKFIFINKNNHKINILNFMQPKKIIHLPVIDNNQKLFGFYVLNAPGNRSFQRV